MACTELLGVITVAFEFTRYTEHRIIPFGSFTVKPLIVFFINKTHYLNKRVGVVRLVLL